MENKSRMDDDLLKDLCVQFGLSFEKMLKLLETVKEHQFKDRRSGVYDALKEIIKSDLKPTNNEV
ncbi:MAG: DNA modification system-associated small protein [Gelidibacter sp.]